MELKEIIQKGESENLELKENLSKDLAKVVTAFANTKGGKIIIGVNDLGEVLGIEGKIKIPKAKERIAEILQSLTPLPAYKVEFTKLDDKQLIVIDVQESGSIISYRNIAYIRNLANNYPLSVKELIEKGAESLIISFDRQTTEIKDSEIDNEIFDNYLKKREELRSISTRPNKENLEKLGFSKNGNLTNAGVLCLTESPQYHLPNSGIRVIIFSGTTKEDYSERKEFTGNLWKMVTEIEEFLLSKFSIIAGPRIGFEQKSYSSYPISAVREAILNAIIHRNYFDDSDIRIFLYNNKLEIVNPGSFPPGVSVQKPFHKPRNPVLAQYFYDIGLIEKYGSGVEKILNDTRKHPFVNVEFDLTTFSTTVIFKQDINKIKLDDIDKQIIEALSIKERSSTELSELTDLSRQAIFERLNDLISIGFVQKKEGLSGKSTRYIAAK